MNSKIYDLKEINIPFSKFVQIKIMSNLEINFEFIETLSENFKSFVLSEKKDCSKYTYFIGGEIKYSYFMTVFKLFLNFCRNENE